MADATNAPIAAPTAPQVAPVAPEATPVSQPFSIPASMTAEAAGLRIKELQGDRDFASRYCAGGVRENAELDALLRHSLNQAQPEPQQKPISPAEAPPADPGMYTLHDPLMELAGGKEALADWQQTAHAVGLPLGWFSSISKQAEVDAAKHAGMSEEEIIGQVDDQLHGIFGDRHDRALEGARRVVAEIEARHPGALAKIQAAGLAQNLAVLTWLMQKGLERR